MDTKKYLRRRDFLRIAGGVTAGALLSACVSPAKTPTPSAAPSTPETPPTAAPQVGKAEVTIRIAQVSGPVMAPDQMITECFDAYKKANPHVKFERETAPFADYFQKLGLGLSSKTAADIFMVNEVWAYAEAGHLMPAPKEYTEDIRANFGAAAKPPDYKGNVYGYPFEGGLRLCLYNKAHFKEAGLGEPTAAQDWNQLVDWAKALTKTKDGEITQEGWKVTQAGYWICVAEWFWTAGGEFCTGDCGEFKLDQPAWMQAVQWWADMALKHKVASTKFAADTFAKGQSSMTVDGLFSVGQLREFSQVDFGAFMIPPQTSGGQFYHDDGPWMYGVNAAAKPEVQAEAWKFLQWLTNDENGVSFSKNCISVYRQSALDRAIKEVDPIIRVFLEASRDHMHPRTPKYWRNWVTRVQGPLAKVFLGELGAEEMAKTVEQQINEDIKQGAGSL